MMLSKNFEDAKSESEGEEEKAIEAVENEFSEWAKSFLEKKDSSRVEFEKKQLSAIEHELENSRIVRPVFDYILGCISNMIQAFNDQNGTGFIAKINSLPENLYKEKYECTVVFNDTNYWGCRVYWSGDFPNRIIFLSIQFQQDEKREGLGDGVLIIVQSEYSKITFNIENSVIPQSDRLDEISLDSYEEELKSAITYIFEAQIHSQVLNVV